MILFWIQQWCSLTVHVLKTRYPRRPLNSCASAPVQTPFLKTKPTDIEDTEEERQASERISRYNYFVYNSRFPQASRDITNARG